MIATTTLADLAAQVLAGNRAAAAVLADAIEEDATVPPCITLDALHRVMTDAELHEVACRYAEHVLHIWEAVYPKNRRPRQAIAAKRAWLRGEISDDKLRAAWSAARSAAWDAAWSAARDAAWSAAWSAAWFAARSAARSAARDAARSAAWDANRSAARDAKRRWQIQAALRLLGEGA